MGVSSKLAHLLVCQGHWTHTAFLHFLLCITLLSSYAFVLCGNVIWTAISYPNAVVRIAPLIHRKKLAASLTTVIFYADRKDGGLLTDHDDDRRHFLHVGRLLSLVSCVPGHVRKRNYLLFEYSQPSNRTNQTTLESLSPFLLLRYLPRTPASAELMQTYPGRYSCPPLEHELSSAQRRHLRRAHSSIRMYDVGWRQNWWQVVGWNRRWGWVGRLLYGGGG